QALDSENRIVRERLLAGDLDAWLESPESSSEPTMPSVYTSSAPPPRRKPGRWAVKVGMVESPFAANASSPPRPEGDGRRRPGQERSASAAAGPPASAPPVAGPPAVELREAVPEPIPSYSGPPDVRLTQPDLPTRPRPAGPHSGTPSSWDGGTTRA